MKKLLIIAMLFLISGCAPDPNDVSPEPKWKDIIEGWKGQHYSVIIQKMGAYTREVEDGLGGRILIWSVYYPPKTKTNFHPRGDIGDFDFVFYETHTPANTEELQLFVNKNGEIYNVSYKKY